MLKLKLQYFGHLMQGNGNPLQYSCLANPMDREAWRATAHKVTKSQKQLRRLSTHYCFSLIISFHFSLFILYCFYCLIQCYSVFYVLCTWASETSRNRKICKKLKLQYFGYLMRRANSLGKTPMLGKIEGKRRRGWQRMKWLDSITDSMDMNLSKL